MLSYRHQFHAGNVSDVFKHAILTRLLLALAKKDKPFCYLDTHAGLGRYDLTHPWSQKTAEWRHGIGRVWARADAPAALQRYLEIIRAENPDGHLHCYPGSPWIARQLMRPDDRLVLCELNKDDCAALKTVFASARHTAIHNQDGFQAIRGYLPPKERRGLTFIDAAFDEADEFGRITRAVKEACTRFATGMIAVWYPLMAPAAMQAFARSLQSIGLPKTLQLELSVYPEDWTAHIRGSGMIVVNPPFGLDREAPPLLDWLWRALSAEQRGGTRCVWLVPE
ncbi:MAG: 23S rRNA (adenine(2030)-N(6))-methyltransferase RlmJ [Betaproteobacteria bacterium]|nr:MAG: 23S rRNA (adenine(2030)-N(6))-methyltransferase RlmJ [Betaproteobacteria bacterium]